MTRKFDRRIGNFRKMNLYQTGSGRLGITILAMFAQEDIGDDSVTPVRKRWKQIRFRNKICEKCIKFAKFNQKI